MGRPGQNGGIGVLGSGSITSSGGSKREVIVMCDRG